MKSRLNLDSTDAHELWQKANVVSYARWISLISAVLMLFLIPFDWFFLGTESYHLIHLRVIAAVGIASNLICFRELTKSKQGKRIHFWVQQLFMIMPLFIWSLLYTYTIYLYQVSNFNIYYLGFVLIIGFASLLCHRFTFAQNAFNLATIFLVALSLPFYSELRDFTLVIIICNVVCMFLLAVLRYDFRNSIQNRFHLLSGILPARIAETLALSSENSQQMDMFLPRSRVVACVCADWRNFQVLTEKRSALDISSMLERFYDEVLLALDRIVPSGNYFVNWTADELFIVFFDEDDRPHIVQKESASFVMALLTEVFEKVEKEFRGEILYDVGYSVGQGLLGLQGPRSLKKTTIAGEVAGLAKRHQEEAKVIRQGLSANTRPILVVNQDVLDRRVFDEFFPRGEFRSTMARGKNIAGKTCFAWTLDFSKVSRKSA
ncbi:MAG: hypothetical protein WCH11_03955 [Bdellovibrio sp.]